MPDVQPRVSIASRHPDPETGPDEQGIEVPPASHEQMLRTIALRQVQLMRMIADQSFNYSHPVDEYAPQGGTAVITNTVTLQPDYDMPERITTVTAIVPVGATSASLQLGQRTLTLYSGTALTTPGIIVLVVHGIIVNSDDPRILTLGGTLTTPPYLGLTGYALTRGQFS
jgi:hypothetical protein